jgi:hypothetical protein
MQQKGTTVLHLATKYSEGSIVSALLTAKANVNAARAVWHTIESINLAIGQLLLLTSMLVVRFRMVVPHCIWCAKNRFWSYCWIMSPTSTPHSWYVCTTTSWLVGWLVD